MKRRMWLRRAAAILLTVGLAAGGGLLYWSANARIVAAEARLDETAQGLAAAQEALRAAEAAKAELETRIQTLNTQIEELFLIFGIVPWWDVPADGLITEELVASLSPSVRVDEMFRPRITMLLSESLRSARPAEATPEDRAWLARVFHFWPSEDPLPADHYLTVEFDRPVRFWVGARPVAAEAVTLVVRGTSVRLLFSNGRGQGLVMVGSAEVPAWWAQALAQFIVDYPDWLLGGSD